MNKKIKLGGLLGLVAAVGYGVYKKKKMTIEIQPEQEVIDIAPEQPEEKSTRK